MDRKYSRPYVPSKFTMEDLIKFVQDFHLNNERVPTIEDVKKLHKESRTPSVKAFYKKGGLLWIIERAGFPAPNKYNARYDRGEVFRKFKEFTANFLSIHARLPSSTECEKEFKICAETFKLHTGMTFREALTNLSTFGASPRRGKLANLPPTKNDELLR